MILDRLFGLEERSRFRPVTGAGIEKDATLKEVFGAKGDTYSGVDIEEENCLGLSAVYAAVRLLSWTPAQLPLVVYRREENGDKEPQPGHWAYPLVHDQANPEMSAMKFREIGQVFVLNRGRFMAFLERDNRGVVRAMWPLHTASVKRERLPNGQLSYDITRCKDEDEFPKPPTTKAILFRDEVLEISNLGGKGIITHAREQMGEAMAAQNFGGGFFYGGSLFAFAVKHRGKLKDPDELRKNLEGVHGFRRRIAVLSGGEFELEKLGMPLKDAQFLESRQFHVTEIARWYGIPPHKLRDLMRATFSNIYEQKLEWYEDLLPWLLLWEQALTRRLLSTNAGKGLFVEHVVDGLLKADIEKRFNAHREGLQWAFAQPNEVRRRENWNSLGPAGDVIFIPQNMHIVPITPEAKTFYEKLGLVKSAEQLEAAQAATQALADGVGQQAEDEGDVKDEGDEKAKNAAKQALRSRIEKALDKEAAEVGRATRTVKDFVSWLDRFYSRWLAKMMALLEPAAETCRMVGIKVDAEDLAFEHCQTAHGALLELSGQVTQDELAERVTRELEQWRALVPDQILGGLDCAVTNT